jgi:orotate phosphoribosyltransferase
VTNIVYFSKKGYRMLKQTEIADMFKESGAFLTGHFLLTSGLHSPHYFQCAKVLQFPEYTTLLCTDIARQIEKMEIDLVVGPALGGIVVAQEIGRILNKRTIFAERENNEMTLRRGFEIRKGERVLIAEDVLTTGKSIREVIGLVEKAGGTMTAVSVILDRSAGKVSFGAPLVSLMAMDVVTHAPDACPICKTGVPLVKPGSRKQRTEP